MNLDKDTLAQISQIFEPIESDITLVAVANPSQEYSAGMIDFLKDFVSASPKLTLEIVPSDNTPAQFSLRCGGEETGIIFRGIPTGHEFTSLLLAVLNADGKGKNLPDETLAARIRSLRGPLTLRTFVSLTCTNCPDVVQALNVVALYNPLISSIMIDGAFFPEETAAFNVQSVPTVYADDSLLSVGRATLGELVDKLEKSVGADEALSAGPVLRDYDVVVVGGGPAGVTAAIYSARKGLRTAVVCSAIGGQVRETVAIENLISVPHTTGADLAANLRKHLGLYAVDIFENRNVEHVDLRTKVKDISCARGETFRAPSVIIATGASWRRLGVPGEEEYIGRGVAFCPHCDGPFYEGKPVAVIGGGNSGIEAALDLAGICSHVTVLEFADSLRADRVLIDKARRTPNVDIITSARTTAITGNGSKVTGLDYENRATGEKHSLTLDGVFVQIGLIPNSGIFKGQLDINERGEIVTDDFCRTSQRGVYAAGDVSSVPYKQIVIAIGEGAKAALTAFDDRLRTS